MNFDFHYQALLSRLEQPVTWNPCVFSNCRDCLLVHMDGWEAEVVGEGELVVVFLMIPQAQCLRECLASFVISDTYASLYQAMHSNFLKAAPPTPTDYGKISRRSTTEKC